MSAFGGKADVKNKHYYTRLESALCPGCVKPGVLTVHLGLVEACYLRVALDDRFEFGMACDFIEVGKTVRRSFLHHVDYTLWTTSAVVLDYLSSDRQAGGFIRLECQLDILRLGQKRRQATRIKDRLTRPV